MDFYPSISQQQLHQALLFAKRFTNISESEAEIISHACKTVLVNSDGTWVKKDGSDLFDIPMESFHGSEVSDLIGLYIMDKISRLFDSGTYGLYHGDGLAVIPKTPDQISTDSAKLYAMKWIKSGLKSRLILETPEQTF